VTVTDPHIRTSTFYGYLLPLSAVDVPVRCMCMAVCCRCWWIRWWNDLRRLHTGTMKYLIHFCCESAVRSALWWQFTPTMPTFKTQLTRWVESRCRPVWTQFADHATQLNSTQVNQLLSQASKQRMVCAQLVAWRSW